MKEIGIIREVHGKKALVEIQRHSACGDCGACHMGKEQSTMETTALNPIDAKVGDAVEVEMEFANVLKATSIMYGIPLVAFLLGASLSYAFIIGMGTDWDQVLVPFFSGIALMAVSYGGIRFLDKKGLFSSKYQSVITGLVNKNETDKTPVKSKMG